MIFNNDNLKFTVLSMGIFSHQSGKYNVKPRPYAALAFRKDGYGKFTVAGKEILSEKSDVLFIPSGVAYTVEYCDGQSIVIHLKDCNYREFENVRIANPDQIKKAFERTYTNWQGRCSQNKAKSDLYSILDLLSRDNKSLKNDKSFSQCMSYIHENLDNPNFSVEDVCKRFFISHSSLQRRFNKYIGICPKQYVLKLRLDKGYGLLLDGNASIKEVAASCGFADEKYFSRAFKQAFGMPPSSVKSQKFI